MKLILHEMGCIRLEALDHVNGVIFAFFNRIFARSELYNLARYLLLLNSLTRNCNGLEVEEIDVLAIDIKKDKLG